jgi:hypothetical protein
MVKLAKTVQRNADIAKMRFLLSVRPVSVGSYLDVALSILKGGTPSLGDSSRPCYFGLGTYCPRRFQNLIHALTQWPLNAGLFDRLEMFCSSEHSVT